MSDDDIEGGEEQSRPPRPAYAVSRSQILDKNNNIKEENGYFIRQKSGKMSKEGLTKVGGSTPALGAKTTKLGPGQLQIHIPANNSQSNPTSASAQQQQPRGINRMNCKKLHKYYW